MSINVEFVATVGKWPEERQDEVYAALKAWAYEDEGLNPREVCVDILGGSPRNPILRMEAYTYGPIIISRFYEWSGPAEERLRQRITAAGGSEVRIDWTFPDED